MPKRFIEMQNVGTAKYVVSYHDGVKKHNDGSDFFDVRLFSSRRCKDQFVRELIAEGYADAY